VAETGKSNHGRAQASALPGTLPIGIGSQIITQLNNAITPQNWVTLLQKLNINNHRKNYIKFMLTLIEFGWMAMTLLILVRPFTSSFTFFFFNTSENILLSRTANFVLFFAFIGDFFCQPILGIHTS